MQNKLTLTIIFIVFFSSIKAQELKDYNLYNQNPMLYNPSFALSNEYLRVYVNSHLQWIGFDGAPKNNELGASISFLPNMAAGLSVRNYKAGLFNNFRADLKYAYKIDFTENHFLKMGLSLGVNNDKLLPENAQFVDLTDQNLTTDYYNKTVFSSGLGLFYNLQNFDAQFIMPQLFEYKKANIYSIGILAYNFELNENLDLKPSVLVRGAKASPFQFDGNIMATWNKTIWSQFAYRSNNSFIFSVGINYSNYAVGYAYQADTRPISTTNSGTHEIQLIYRFNKNDNEVINKSGKTRVTGYIKNTTEEIPVSAIITVFENEEQVAEVYSDGKSGYYIIDLLPGKTYSFEVNSDDFYPSKDIIIIEQNSGDLQKNFFLKPKNTMVYGNISNLFNEKPVNAKILVLEGNEIKDTLQTKDDGSYSIYLQPQTTYNFKVTAENFEPAEAKIEITNETEFEQNYKLTPQLFIYGVITDSKTGKPLAASIEIFDNDKNDIFSMFSSNSSTGKYKINLTGLKNFSITATFPNYMFYSDKFEIDYTTFEIEKNIEMQPIETGAKVILKNVHFDTGKSDLRDESIPEINRLIMIMKQFPNIKIEISGHTDNVGTKQYNEQLSQSRAQTVVDYMIKNGISKERLTAKGYGSSVPIASNDTEEGKQLNRRVEAKIVE